MTDKQTEALKLALKYLLALSVEYRAPEIITAIREALALVNEVDQEQPRLLSAAPCDQCGYNGPGYYQPKTHPCASKHHKALAQERSSDEQPAQQEDPCPGCRKGRVCRTPKCGRLKLPADHPYRTDQPAQQQEPVAWTPTETLNKRETTTRGYLWFSNPQNNSWTPLYTSPPAQRKPLTDEEVGELLGLFPKYASEWGYGDFYQFAQAIEAAHNIKGDA